MKIVDANVLLYAVNEDAEHHAASRSWLDGALGGAASVGLAIEHRAQIVTFDRDFDRFPGVRWERPTP